MFVQFWRLEAGVQHCRNAIRGFPWWWAQCESTTCPGARKWFKYLIKNTVSNQSKALIIPWYSDWCSFTSGVWSLSWYRKDIKNIKMYPKEATNMRTHASWAKKGGKEPIWFCFIQLALEIFVPWQRSWNIKCLGWKYSCYYKQSKNILLSS